MMKIHSRHDDAAAEAIASRWNLNLLGCVAETQRARIFRVDGPTGPAALKLYKQIGSSGENASVPFLRDLKAGAGPKIHRVSTMRTAVLMDWLEGPSLQDLVASGDEVRATKLLANVARAVTQSTFRFPIIYGRQLPSLRKTLASGAGTKDDAPFQNAIKRALVLLDQLARTSPAEQVIHGDLGFGNVILTADGPKLIDPKGLRADPICEYARALVMSYENYTAQEFADIATYRANLIAAEADVPAARIIQWATVNLARKATNRARKRNDEVNLLPYLTALLAVSEKD